MKRLVVALSIAMAIPSFVRAQEIILETVEQTVNEEPVKLGFAITPTFGHLFHNSGRDFLWYGDYLGADLEFRLYEPSRSGIVPRFELSTKFGIEREYYNAMAMFGETFSIIDIRRDKFSSLMWFDFGIGLGYNWSEIWRSQAVVGMRWGFGVRFFGRFELGVRLVMLTSLDFSRRSFVSTETSIGIRF